MSVRVLGIDPGLRVTGYGVVEQSAGGATLIEAGVIAPKIGGTLEIRLRDLHAGITEVVVTASPDWIVIEELYTTYRNPQTAILMGHARGVLCLAAAQHGVAVRTLGHTLVKRALVGSGGARKEQVNLMVTELLGLRRRPEPNDVSDALALALAFLGLREREQRLPAALLRVANDNRRLA